MPVIPLRRRWHGPPLALQILALLIGGLFVAQFVTLLLTLVLPPAPPAQYGLDDIAAALRGEAAGDDTRSLQRFSQKGPPDLSGPGWLVSDRSRIELAALLGTDVASVRLAFYTPLPFAGTAAPPAIALRANDGPVRPLALLTANRLSDGAGREFRTGLILVQAAGLPAAPPVLPAGEAGRVPPPRDSFPPRTFRGLLPRGDLGRPRGGLVGGMPAPIGGERSSGRGLLYEIDPRPVSGRSDRAIFIPGDDGVAVPPILQGLPPQTTAPPAATGPTTQVPGTTQIPNDAAIRGRSEVPGAFRGQSGFTVGRPPPGSPMVTMPGTMLRERDAAPVRNPPSLVTAAPASPPAPPAAAAAQAPIRNPASAEPSAAVPSAAPPVAQAVPAPPSADPIPEDAEAAIGAPIAVARTARGLFGLAPAPYVEGDFVAALRQADGRWSIVQPVPEPFPNAWQRRVLLWFAIALAIVVPLGWLFARRLVTPLGRFAGAAERLGRDPAAAVIALDGPAEIGRAANAFNLMQTRLRSFVDDRTAMIGAISHDLRTPLTRMRFRIEDVDDEVREGLLEEVAEMEAMISSVLEFIRDASAPGLRERIDLATLIEDVVEDAAMIGGDVSVQASTPAVVDIDVLGLRRVLDNLIANAVKYGGQARIRLSTAGGHAVAEIIDGGAGLPEYEMERVFEPFYRSEAARSSDKGGHGLGLAVCRSIARAHGGDVRLRHTDCGFLAELRVPLAFGT